MKDLREMLLQERDERIDGDTNIDNFFRFWFYNSLLEKNDEILFLQCYN